MLDDALLDRLLEFKLDPERLSVSGFLSLSLFSRFVSAIPSANHLRSRRVFGPSEIAASVYSCSRTPEPGQSAQFAAQLAWSIHPRARHTYKIIPAERTAQFSARQH